MVKLLHIKHINFYVQVSTALVLHTTVSPNTPDHTNVCLNIYINIYIYIYIYIYTYIANKQTYIQLYLQACQAQVCCGADLQEAEKEVLGVRVA